MNLQSGIYMMMAQTRDQSVSHIQDRFNLFHFYQKISEEVKNAFEKFTVN